MLPMKRAWLLALCAAASLLPGPGESRSDESAGKRIAARIAEITDTAGERILDSAFDQTNKFATIAARSLASNPIEKVK